MGRRQDPPPRRKTLFFILTLLFSMSSTISFSTPVFGLVWLRDDLIVHIGGGGSSKTGIGNRIEMSRVRADGTLENLSTYDSGDELGAALAVEGTRMIACFGPKLRSFNLGSSIEFVNEVIADTHENDPMLNCCRLEAGAAACGGEDGILRLYESSSLSKTKECSKHDAAITDVNFASGGHLACTSSKDKTCRVWSTATGRCLSVLNVAQFCPEPPSPPTKKRRPLPAAKLSCRSCTFIDESTLCSVASYTRGPAYLHAWTLEVEGGNDEGMSLRASVDEARMMAVSKYPVSAATLVSPRQDDDSLLAVGDVEGHVIVVGNAFNKLAQAKLHDLPVTALAYSPSSRVFYSASADSKFGTLAVTPSRFSFFLLSLLVAVLAVLVALLSTSLFTSS